MKHAKQKSELGQYLYSILTVVGLFSGHSHQCGAGLLHPF